MLATGKNMFCVYYTHITILTGVNFTLMLADVEFPETLCNSYNYTRYYHTLALFPGFPSSASVHNMTFDPMEISKIILCVLAKEGEPGNEANHTM